MKLRALALAMLVGFAAISGPVALTGVGAAANAGNTAISDPSDGPIPGAGNVAVTQLELQSEDAVVNAHDGTVDAQVGDAVGTFGSDTHYHDTDGSTDYTTGDEVLLDNDGDATYTASPDTLVSGLPTGSAVTTANGFDADWSLRSYDADDSDGAFDASEDAIVMESRSGGTYSAGADTVLNSGDRNVDVSVGATLHPMRDISGAADGPHLVDSNGNGEFDAGEDTVADLDEDDQFTGQEDDPLDHDGSDTQNDIFFTSNFDAPAGASLTGAETVSIPAGDDGLPNNNALYYVDSDDSGDYTTEDELVLDPNAGSTTSLTYDNSTGSDEDGDGSAGDDILLSIGDDNTNNANDGDTLARFRASDHVAFEDSGHDGTADGEYQQDEEIYIDYNDGGTVSTGPDTLLNEGTGDDRSAGDPLVALNGLDSPSGLRWHDKDGNGVYNGGDEIVVDEDSDGVYTGSADTVVAGTAPSAGASLSAGQDGDWAIDAHDAVDGTDWDRTTDGLFLDGGDGAFSTDDTLVAGERIPGGTAVTTANGFDGDWSLDSFDADDTDGAFDASEDTIVYQSRDNGEYTASTDTVLNFGSDADVDSSAGTTVEPMSDITSSYYLADSNGNGELDAGEDVLYIGSSDDDGVYTERADTFVDADGTGSTSDYGASDVTQLGTDLTGVESVSIPAGGQDMGNELYYVDSDDSGNYTLTDEVVLDANADNAASLTLDTDPSSNEDGDGDFGGDAILVYGSDGTNGASEGDTLQQFQASDEVAFESGGQRSGETNDDQYQDGEDIVVDYSGGGTVSFEYALSEEDIRNDGGDQQADGGDDLVWLGTLSTPSGIGWLDTDGSNTYTSGDEIVIDDDGDGAYTASTDLVVAGTPPGAGASVSGGQDGDWTIDAHDASDGGSWDGTTDALFVDANGGGTFSAVADTRINAGEDDTFEVADGVALSDLDESTYGYVDIDGNGLDSGDEVHTEGDADSPSAAGVYGETLTALTVEQTGTLAAQHIEQVSLYRDDGDGTLEPGSDDALVQASSTRTGSTYAFTGLSEAIAPGGTAHFVAVDLAEGAPEGDTLQFDVPPAGITFAQAGTTGNIDGSALEIDVPNLALTSPSTVQTRSPDRPTDEADDTLSVSYQYQLGGTDATTVRLVSTTDPSDHYEYRVPDSEYDDTATTRSLTIDLDDNMTGSGGSFATNPEDLADGEYDIELAVTDDESGRFTTTSDRALLAIDDSPPTVRTATLGTTGTVDWFGDGSVRVDYAFSDGGPGTPDLEVTLADGNGNSVTNVYTDVPTTSGTRTLSQSDSFERTTGAGIVPGNSYEATVRVVDDSGLSASRTDTGNTATIEEPSLAITSPSTVQTRSPDRPTDEADDTLSVGYSYDSVDTDATTVRLISTSDSSNHYEYRVPDSEYDDTATSRSLTLDIDDDMTAAAGSFTTNPEDLPDGTYTIELVVDNAGGGETTVESGTPLVRLDDTAPTFSNGGTVDAEIDEGTTGAVLDVQADDDTGSDYDAAVTYSLRGPDSGPFSIGGDTGELVLDSEQDFESPADSNTDGVYELAVTATDDAGVTATQTITVTLRDRSEGSDGGGGGEGYDPNDPPTAADDSYTTTVNTTLSVTAANGIMANDSDPDDDRDTLSMAVESRPDNGTLHLAGNGSFTYTPDEAFTGNDSFTYEVSDGDGGDDTATATISVTPGPSRVSDPIVFENASEMHQRLPIPANATPTAAERITVADDGTGPVAANFTENSAVASMRFSTAASGNLTVIEYAEPPSRYEDVPGSIVTPWQMTGSPAFEDVTGTVRVRVSQSELGTVDADTSALRITSRVDGEWQLLNTTVVSRDSESVRLAATTDGLSSFAVTAVGTPDAVLSVQPTSVSPGDQLTLDARNSTTPYGEIVGYDWSIGGETDTGETATVTLEEPGAHTIELTVTNDAGRTATATATVVVETETRGERTPDETPGDATPTGPVTSPTEDPQDRSTRTALSTPSTDDTTAQSETTTGGAGPGFGVLLGLVALAGIALLGIRRQQ